jgi:hypothetical protein
MFLNGFSFFVQDRFIVSWYPFAVTKEPPMVSNPQTAVTLVLAVILSTTCLGPFANAEQKARNITVTGCLQKGNVLDRFKLTAHDGKAYALRSASVKLSDHVGHNVTIKGALKRDPKRDDYDFEGSEVSEGYGKDQVSDLVDLDVASLKMNSPSCPVAPGK